MCHMQEEADQDEGNGTENCTHGLSVIAKQRRQEKKKHDSCYPFDCDC